MTSVSLGPFGEPLDYSRQKTFGYPFIDKAPLLPDNELMASSQLVYRFGYGVFSTANRSKRIYNRTYGEIMENVANQQFKLLARTEFARQADGHYEVYIEWLEPYHLMKNQMMPPRIEENAEDTQQVQEAKADRIEQKPAKPIKRRGLRGRTKKQPNFTGF
jgi:hypothetical protein